jgi:RNA polymerase sigma factor (sigma-70 family)
MMQRYQRLVDEHRHRVFTFAAYYLRDLQEAEDVTQEVLLRLWQNLEKLEPDAVAPWLTRVTRNACHDVYRRRRASRESLQVGDSLPDTADIAPNPLASAETSDFQRRLDDALRRIADPYRTILILREVQDLKYEQIAESLELPLNTVKVYLHRGRKLLRDELREHFHV